MVALVVAVWYAMPWIQLTRADLMLEDANGRIERANQLLLETRLAELGLGSFTSLENISRNGEAVNAALPRLNEARNETQEAAVGMRRARSLILLPAWYPEYLGKKEEIANLRLEQIDRLEEAAINLNDLYGSGEAVFTANREMDRLMGQIQAALGALPGNPAAAGSQLEQIAQQMRLVQGQLDEAYNKQNFQLLSELSRAAGSHAELAEASVQLAQATAAGDQTRAQQAAVAVENKHQEAAIVRDHLDQWWLQWISPLEEEINSLRSRQQELDAEAEEIYGKRS